MRKKAPLWKEMAYWLVLGLLMALSVLMLFKRLGLGGIQAVDEARHGVNAYEMLQSGNYLVNTYLGEVDYWNLKPPLSMYGIVLGYRLFGLNSFGLRFYSAASTLALMGILALWTRRRFGRAASLATQAALLACNFVFHFHFARSGDPDALYVLFYTLSMLCMLESRRDVRWLYGSALGFGLSFMTKSWHAALIPVTCLVYLCATGEIRRLKVKHYALLLGCGLLPILPWAIARIRFDGLAFFRSAVDSDVLKRVTTVHEGHSGGWLYYASYLFEDAASILGLVACAGMLLWKRVRRKRLTLDEWGVALWFAVPVALFTLCRSKLQWYVFPSVIALAVGTGAFCQGLWRGPGRLWLRMAALTAVGCVLAYGCAVNLQEITSIAPDRYEQVMQTVLDRAQDGGMHAYIQYENREDWPEPGHWDAGDLLFARLQGDVECLEGGAAAFVADETPALLIAHESVQEGHLEDADVIYSLSPIRVYQSRK